MPIHKGHSGRIFWGIFLILIGVLFLLDRMGRFDFDLGYLISHYWPVIFIAIGLSIWLSSGFHDFVSGLFFVAFGTVFLLIRLGVLEHHVWHYLWPGLILIFIGLWIILGPLFRHHGGNTPEIKADDLAISAVFAGMKRRVESQSFRGGHATAVLGSVDLDFTAAALAEGRATVELSAIMGSVEVKVPKDWQVVLDGTPILGGIEDKHKSISLAEAKGTLFIKATAILGSVLVKD
jgi:predicted membrane protein